MRQATAPTPNLNRSVWFVGYLESGKMDDAVNVWMRLEDAIEIILLSDVNVEKVRSLAADELNSIDGFFGGIVEIVCNDDLVICFE